jgi:hypothetical protein
MFLEKIKQRKSGLLLYGITPPKIGTDENKIDNYAKKTVERVNSLDIDALIVYDVQDESERIAEERPFPFLNALDPLYFTERYLHDIATSKIIYKPAGKFFSNELDNWLQRIAILGFHPVFVGVPSPDHVPKTSLVEAYELYKKYSETSKLGGVTIPERHFALRDEDDRIFAKVNKGVSYFITQCVFDIGFSKDLIDSIVAYSANHQQQIPTIIFTLTSCGSERTLHFIEWLGIYIPAEMKARLLQSKDILSDSVNICLNHAQALTEYCLERNVPFGFNIESVAIKKDEIEATITMTKTIEGILKRYQLR